MTDESQHEAAPAKPEKAKTKPAAKKAAKPEQAEVLSRRQKRQRAELSREA